MSVGTDRQDLVDTVLTEHEAPAASTLSSPVLGSADLSEELAHYAYPAAKPLFELLQQQWRSLGVDLRPGLSTTADLTARRASGDHDVLFRVNTRPDSEVLVSNYASTSSQVYALAPQTDVDDFLARQSAELDAAARNALPAQVQQIALERTLSVSLYEGGSVVAGKGVDGVHGRGGWSWTGTLAPPPPGRSVTAGRRTP